VLAVALALVVGQTETTQLLALLLLSVAVEVVVDTEMPLLVSLEDQVVVEVALPQAARNLVGQGHLLKDLLVVLEII
jgi:hypothetical protein